MNSNKYYDFAKNELFSICRSITGKGAEQTLKKIKKFFPKLKIHKVKSGTKIFDWKIPDEWNIRDAYVVDKNKKNYDDEVQYLKSINISVKVHEINKNNIVRAEQLCNKTNQFNLNLKRLNQKEIIKLTKNKNYDLKMLSLKDDYGDHGLIAIYGINFQKDKFKIDLFAMSCRVLGRYLENWILNKIKDYAKIKKKILFMLIL